MAGNLNSRLSVFINKMNNLKGITISGTVTDIQVDATGRVITAPYQVRDFQTTAFATLTRGVETEVIAGDASKKIDVVTITGANSSGIAQTIEIRVGTGGSVIDSLVVPATNIISKSYIVPLLSSETGQSWTGKNTTVGEHSDSPVDLTMTAIKN